MGTLNTWLEYGRALDIALLRKINVDWSGSFLDRLMAAVSDFNLFLIPLIAGAMLLIVFGNFRERLLIVLLALCVLIGDTGISSTLKATVYRPRPHEALEGIREVSLKEITWSHPTPHHRGRSFPSSHVCNNVALALVAVMLYGRWAHLLWFWALLMSYSRVYVGSHYPSDTAASWIIALVYTWAILRGCEWLWQKYAPRLTPGLYAAHPRLQRLKADG